MFTISQHCFRTSMFPSWTTGNFFCTIFFLIKFVFKSDVKLFYSALALQIAVRDAVKLTPVLTVIFQLINLANSYVPSPSIYY